MEKYELVKDVGSRNFGVARLMRNKETKELVAMKYIERGHKIDENVAREIINHRLCDFGYSKVRFIVLQNRRGKTRVAKYYIPLEESEKHKLEYEVAQILFTNLGNPDVHGFSPAST